MAHMIRLLLVIAFFSPNYGWSLPTTPLQKTLARFKASQKWMDIQKAKTLGDLFTGTKRSVVEKNVQLFLKKYGSQNMPRVDILNDYIFFMNYGRKTYSLKIVGEKDSFLKYKDLNIKESEFKDLEALTLKIAKYLGKESKTSAQHWLYLILPQAHARTPWGAIAIGAGIALLGYFLYKGMQELSEIHTTHEVNTNHQFGVNGEVSGSVSGDADININMNGGDSLPDMNIPADVINRLGQ